MEANELRIGNYILNENDDVVLLCESRFRIMIKGNINYKPILLTEEWLLKFGFKKNYNNQFILMEGSVDILFNKDLNGWTCDGINFSINMTEHVHQLQNLYFALTGEELTFKS